MGKLGMPAEMPNTEGLPEFFITDIQTEIDGQNIRVVCGARRGGRVHWLYSAVMPAERVFIAARQCSDAAVEAFSLQQSMDRRASH
jgi:hypothetical protein